MKGLMIMFGSKVSIRWARIWRGRWGKGDGQTDFLNCWYTYRFVGPLTILVATGEHITLEQRITLDRAYWSAEFP